MATRIGSMMATTTSSTGDSMLNAEEGKKMSKRKMAIVLGYVGSKYSGLQMDPTSGTDTIESRLAEALYQSGCILDSNRNQLSKLGWSRSSRTDKGGT